MTLDLERNPRRGDLLEVEIEGVDTDGCGLGSLDVRVGPQRAPRRLRVEVRGGLPGDRLRVDVGSCKQGVVVGRIDALLTPSPQRITPRCVHLTEEVHPCGGCALQALGYEDQLALKHGLVTRALSRAQIDPASIPPVLPSPRPWAYRNKMEFSFGRDGAGRLALGLHPVGRRWDILRQRACHLVSDPAVIVSQAVQDAAEALALPPFRPQDGSGWLRTLTWREGLRTGERLVELTTSHEAPTPDPLGTAQALLQAALDAADAAGAPLTSAVWTQHRAVRGERTTLISQVLHGPGVYHEVLHLPGGHALRFEVHPRAFFQPNPLGAEVLYREVLQATGLLEAPASRVLDLYCGTGTIGLCMAPFAAEIVGVELQPDAVEGANRNARANAITHAEFIAGDVGATLEGPLGARVRGADVAVLDPPRSGLHPKALQHIHAIQPRRLVYVSCNPEALGRDLVELRRLGYHPAAIQPVDMFPQTAHVETVVTLTPPAP